MPKVKLFNEEEALQNAQNVFWKKGYNATSMQNLVDEMQISKQSLYDTFGNKDALFLKAITKYQKEAIAQTIHLLDTNLPIKALFESFFKAALFTIKNDTENKCCFILNTLLESVPDETNVQHLIVANYQQLETKIKAVLNEAKKKNELHSAYTVNQLAAHIIMSFHGIKVISKINKDKKFLENLVKTSLAVFD